MENQNTTPANRAKDVVKRHHPDQIERYEQNGNYFQFFCKNGIILRLHFLTHSIVRFRYALDGEFERDFSYSIDKKFRPTPFSVLFDEENDRYEIASDKLRCIVRKKGMLISLLDNFGNSICEDETGFYLRESIMKGISRLKVTKKAPIGKQFFGLGDKVGASNMRGKAFENWNTDSFGYDDETDPLYRSIPFFYALYEGRAYGIFLDNTFRTRFSFDRQENGISSFEAQGGEMNYYFIYGPQLTDVAKQYLQLTGKPEMPPIWAFGYHQSRWSYYPEAEVRGLAASFRQHKIPCDAIYLDIDYMDGYRCFTWDKNHFPNPKKMIEDLKTEGFKTVVMIDPGIRVDKEYSVYQSGIAQDVFCRREDGKLMKGPVWPEVCVFPDFTNAKVRKWWGDLYKNLVETDGVDGFWNDMNEPAVFEVESKTFPETVRHHYDGNPCSHRKAHNIYGMQMTRATVEGLKKLRPNYRPFVLTRASFAGGQRFAAAWTGDNTSSWKHLHIANIQCQRMSISGFSFVGSDVGGFAQHATAELIVRWLQLGIFHPLYRMHTIGLNLDSGKKISEATIEALKVQGILVNQEPFSYGEPYLSQSRKAIELRYRLLPYLYTAYQRYVSEGDPILKPLVFFDQKDENTYPLNEEFIFGNQILVCPVTKSETTEKSLYLPKGSWYQYFSHQRYEGKQRHTVATPPDEFPMFIKAGTVLPLYPVMQHTNERPVETLECLVFYVNGGEKSTLYEDAGEGLEYQKGEFCLQTFDYQANDKTIRIDRKESGNYRPTYQTILMRFVGLPHARPSIKADDVQIAPTNDGFLVPANFKRIIVSLDEV